jgi:histidyl-tRNA synthetase
MQPQALPGFRDFYPADFAFRAHLLATWREVARRYGFEEYDGPPLESLELYTAKSGPEIVSQLYQFTDKGDRQVALRPEMTPTLARMVAARAGSLRKPIRWFAIPQLFRYERQQRGRLREHFQFNCDLIGEPGPLADAEIIALAIDVMRALGLGPADVRVRLSDRRVMTVLLLQAGVTPESIPLALTAVDRSERMAAEEITAWLLKEPEAGLSEQTIHRILEIARLRGLPEVEAALANVPGGPPAAQDLRRTIQALDHMGLGDFVDVDLTIARGLAYYTGTVFELFDARRTLRAICGGGRYDNLLGSLGGAELPAVGFGMGDVVLGELLRERDRVPAAPPAVQVFVAGVTPDDEPHVLRASHDLRQQGVGVEYALGGQALGKQLNLANARGAWWAVVIGPDDRARGEVQLKDLRGKSQMAVKLEALVGRVVEGLKGRGSERLMD